MKGETIFKAGFLIALTVVFLAAVSLMIPDTSAGAHTLTKGNSQNSITVQLIDEKLDYNSLIEEPDRLRDKRTYSSNPAPEGHLVMSASYSGTTTPPFVVINGQANLNTLLRGSFTKSSGDLSSFKFSGQDMLRNVTFFRQVLSSGSLTEDCSGAAKSSNNTVIELCNFIDTRTYSEVADWRWEWLKISDLGLLKIDKGENIILDIKALVLNASVDVVPRIKIGNSDFEFEELAWFNNTMAFKRQDDISAVGTASATISDMPYAVNGTIGVVNINGACNVNQVIWSIDNVSTDNSTFQFLYYNNCGDLQMVNEIETVAVPYETENVSTLGFDVTAIWSPFNYSVVAHFGEGAGAGTAVDSSSFGNDGTSTGGGITFNDTDELFGNFITHAGASDSYIDFGDTASISKGSTFTASIWFRPYKVGTYQALFDKGANTGGDDQFFARLNPGDNIEYSIDGGVSITSGADVNFGVWNFVVMSFDSAGNVRGWLNGVFDGSASATLVQSTQPMKVCGDTGASGQGEFLGDCDEFRLTNLNLTDDQIEQMYREGTFQLSILGSEEDRPIAIDLLDSSVIPTNLFDGDLFAANITIVNATTEAVVGAGYIDYFGTNITMTLIDPFTNSSGGGVFNYNTTLSETPQTATIKFYGEDTTSAVNVTEIGQDVSVTVISHVVNFELSNSPVVETNWTIFNISIVTGSNVRNVSAYLQWNSTNRSFNGFSNQSFNYNITNNFTVPFYLPANNTNVTFQWSYSLSYINGSVFTDTTTIRNQTVFYAFGFVDLAISELQPLTTSVLNATGRVRSQFDTSGAWVNVSSILNTTVYVNSSYLKNETWEGPSFLDAFRFTNIHMPNFTGTTTNKTLIPYNFSFSVTNGSAFRTTTGLGNIDLNIFRSRIGPCNSGVTVLPMIGLFTYNESTRENVTIDVANTSIDAVFKVFATGNRTILEEFSFALSNNTNYYICSFPGNQTFQFDGDLRYQPNVDGDPRSFFYSNATASNTTTETKLFTLSLANDERVIFVLKDSNGNLLTDYTIKVLKYFQAENLYETVTMTKTDFAGEGLTYLELYDIFYKYIIEFEDEVKGITIVNTIKCTDVDDCKVPLTVEVAQPIEFFDYLGKFGHACNYINSTLTITCTFTDPSALSSQVCLEITQFGFIKPTQESFQCVSTSAGTLGYTFTDFNRSISYTYELTALLSGFGDKPTIIESGFVQQFGPPIAGSQGVIVAILVIGSIVFISLFNPIAGLMLTVFAVGAMQLFGILDLGTGVVAGLGAIVVFMIWRIRRKGST